MKFLWHMSRHYWEKAMERIDDCDFVRNFKNVHNKFLKNRRETGVPKDRHDANKRKRLYGHSEGRLRHKDFLRMAEEGVLDDE